MRSLHSPSLVKPRIPMGSHVIQLDKGVVQWELCGAHFLLSISHLQIILVISLTMRSREGFSRKRAPELCG